MEGVPSAEGHLDADYLTVSNYKGLTAGAEGTLKEVTPAAEI